MSTIFATRLKQLRESRNLSYQEVGDKVGVAKQSIFKFEKGIASPSSDTVIKLSSFFNVGYDYFYDSSDRDNFSLENIQFREDHKLDNKAISEEEIKQSIFDVIKKMLTLEGIVGEKREFENPIEGVDISNEKDIEKAAKTLRKKWKLGFAPITDVIELLEEKGILVIEVRREEEFAGLSGQFNGLVPIIVLNERCLNVERKRFTALHELAHLLLQFSGKLSKKIIEKFCDYFAGAVLLVDEVLLEKIGRNRTTINLMELKQLKEVYGISIAALIVRTHSAGLISYESYQKWWDQYQEWKSQNDEADFGTFRAKESASWFNKLLYRSVIEKKLSVSRAAEIAGSPSDKLEMELASLNFNLI